MSTITYFWIFYVSFGKIYPNLTVVLKLIA